MTIGKLLAGAIVISAVIAGAAMYYLQVYAYYEEVGAEAASDMRLVSLESGAAEPILVEAFQAIDADSSPLRFRACFSTPQSQAMLTETYQTLENATPLNGPGWFDCYNAQDIGNALETGTAIAFLAEKDIADGIDRVIAVYPDGRAFAWHQLNEKYAE